MPSAEQHTVKTRLMNPLSELAGQKAPQAAGRAQEGWVGAKVELQLGYPILVMTSSLGFVVLTLDRSRPCSAAPLPQSLVCDESLRGWGRTSLVPYEGSSSVSTVLSLSPAPGVLLLLL